MLRFPASHFSSAVFRYVGPTACWPALADTNRNAFYAPTVSTGRPSLLLSRIAQQGMMIVIAVMRQRRESLNPTFATVIAVDHMVDRPQSP